MKQLLFVLLSFAVLSVGISASAQETKVKGKTGDKEVKTKGETDKAPTMRGETQKGKTQGQLRGEGAHAAKAGFNLDNVRQEVQTISNSLAQAFSRGDTVAIRKLYHSEALSSQSTMTSGGAGTMGMMGSTIPGMGSNKISLTSTETIGGPELVVESGTYQLTDNSGNVADNGRYMNVLKKEGGKWKIYREMWNSDRGLSGNSGSGSLDPTGQMESSGGNLPSNQNQPTKGNLPSGGNQPLKGNQQPGNIQPSGNQPSGNQPSGGNQPLRNNTPSSGGNR
jgi:ketosteroid isomerase-like protein